MITINNGKLKKVINRVVLMKSLKNKQIIRVVLMPKSNRIHYFQFFDFETISDLKKFLICKYNYPDNITISSKGHPLEDDDKIIDSLKENSKGLCINYSNNMAKLSKYLKNQ